MRVWKALWKQVVLQIRGQVRDKRSLVFSLLFPVVIIIALGAALGNDGVSLKVGLADQDGSAVSQQLIGALQAVPILKLTTGDEAGLRSQVAGNKLDALVVIPAGFGRQAAAKGEAAQVRVVMNEVTSSNGQTVATTVNQVVTAYNLQVAGARPTVVVASEQIQAPDREATGGDFLLAGVLTLMLMALNLNGIMNVVVRQRQSGVLRHIFSTPMPTWTWVTSRIISFGLLSFVNCAVIMGLARIFLHVHLSYRVEALGLVIVAGTYAFLGIGLTISAMVSRVEAVQPINAILMIVLQFLGQLWFPVTAQWMQPVVRLMPTYWLSHALRQVTIYRAPLSGVMTDVAVLGAIAVVTIAFASWRFARLKQVA